MQRAPIFVAGVARSGTTLLQALLGAHPSIAAPPEIHWLLRIYHQREYWGDLGSLDAVRRVVAASLDVPGGQFDEVGLEVDEVMRHLPRTGWTYPDVLTAVMSAYADRQGKPRWSEKSPNQSPGSIWSAFPDALVVHIVRDPRDVAASIANAPFTRQGIVATARAWRRFNADAMADGKAAGSSRYLLVRYEDLCNDTEQVMAAVFRFVGEEAPVGIADDLEARRTAVSARAWWTHGALGAIRPVSAPGRGLSWLKRCLVTRVTLTLLDDLGYAKANRVDSAAGAVAYAVVRMRDRLRRPVPTKPMTPGEHHAHIERLVAEALANLAARGAVEKGGNRRFHRRQRSGWSG